VTLAAQSVGVRLGGREVVRGVSLTVRPGEITAVVGPNGAGKSTFLKALAGLRVPESGQVMLDGRGLATIEARALGREVAYLPQERLVHWPVAVATIVALGRLPHRLLGAGVSAADRKAIVAAMSAMDVAQFAERSVAELSGGERARVLVARALAQEARFLIADEPTAGLDPAHSLTLFAHFRRLADNGRAVVIALHDLSLAVRYCDHALLLKDGESVAQGPPRDVLTVERLATAYGIRATLTSIDGVPVVLPIAPVP
jgi:iron complex transport system ATP-binding protein